MCRHFWLELLNENREGEGQGKEKGEGEGQGGGSGGKKQVTVGGLGGPRQRGCCEGQGLQRGGGGGLEHSSTLGARMMCGPMLSFFSMRLARKLMV